MTHNLLRIGLVVPCYNEGCRLRATDLTEILGRYSETRFCFVNDGSTDNTQQIIDRMVSNSKGQMAAINLPSNKGKAEAVRIGINHILSWQGIELVGYWDADMATPLSELPGFVEVFRREASVEFVCGSRVRRMGAVIERFWYRHYLGRVFATAASLILGLPIYDTQCGAKLIRADLARKIFAKPFMSKWAFDVELLARSIIVLGKEQANRAIFEVPLTNWEDKGQSKMTFREYWIRTPYDLFRVFWNYRDILKC